jgi:hypothetical protein
MSRFTSVKSLLNARKFRRTSMEADGNCFYRAIAAAYHNDVDLHHLLRRATMEHMLESADIYLRYFPSMRVMISKLNSNKRLGVWNNDLADLVPHAVSVMLHCCIEVYSVSDAGEVIKYTFGEGQKIRLLRKNNHYDVLIKD